MNLVLLARRCVRLPGGLGVHVAHSWLLVLKQSPQSGVGHAAFVYSSWQASATAALLLASAAGGGTGDYGFAAIRSASHPACSARSSSSLWSWAPARRPVCAAACLAAAGPSGGAQPRFRADERRHDQGRLYAMIRISSIWSQPLWWWGAGLLVIGGLTAPLGVLYAIMQRDLKTLLAYSTVEISASWSSGSASPSPSRPTACDPCRPCALGRAVPRLQSCAVQEPPLPGAGACWSRPASATGAARRPHSPHAAHGRNRSRRAVAISAAAAVEWLSSPNG